MARRKIRHPWEGWSNERLLSLRMKDLGVTIRGTWLEECAERLHQELEERGLRLRPHVWLSDEWFSPEGVSGIAIPFYLAHPRLMRLERSQMLEVEGGTWRECMRILRHEAGHAFQHAYELQRRSEWRRAFGRSSQKYPDFYRPDPVSRRYVQHLKLWYAQSHPDEDFAETFAVWLKPRSDWRTRYAGWPAMRKLRYVDGVMREIGGEKPIYRSRVHIYPLRRLTKTLSEHYDSRLDRYGYDVPDLWDPDLKRLFSDSARHRRREAASTFLRRNRAEIRRMVSRWTGQYQVAVDAILEEMIGRCRALKLRTVGAERQLKMDFAILLTVKSMEYLYTQSRREWIPL